MLVQGNITIIGRNLPTEVAIKNRAPFINCNANIERTKVEDVQDLDFLMRMYNLLEYSSNYSKTKNTLWFYSKDKTASFNVNIVENNTFKYFKYKLLENTEDGGSSGIYISNFWRSQNYIN